MPAPAFLTAWLRTLPPRLRGLVRPYAQAVGLFVVGYGGLTALLRPWALGRWWGLGVPLVVGFGLCWWLWRPWALLARTTKGESRQFPLLLVWALLLLLGSNLREYLRYRLGEVRDVASVRALAQPGEAVFFRVHGPAYADREHLGRYASWRLARLKGGTQRCYAARYYACPLLATAADTATGPQGPPAWLACTYDSVLGDNLLPGERRWRFANFVARTDARFDSLPLATFTYLLRPEYPAPGLYRAVRASRLAPYLGSPLLLTPVRVPFAARGARSLGLLLWIALLGSGVIIVLLLTLPLRAAPGWG